MLPNSKSNRLTVDKQRYRYIVAESAAVTDNTVPLTITIQNQNNGARLRVIGLTTFRVPKEQSKWYEGRTVGQPVVPQHVAELIRIAISRGWVPALPGPTFVLQIANSEVFPISEKA
jgi:hypothetical protein